MVLIEFGYYGDIWYFHENIDPSTTIRFSAQMHSYRLSILIEILILRYVTCYFELNSLSGIGEVSQKRSLIFLGNKNL